MKNGRRKSGGYFFESSFLDVYEANFYLIIEIVLAKANFFALNLSPAKAGGCSKAKIITNSNNKTQYSNAKKHHKIHCIAR